MQQNLNMTRLFLHALDPEGTFTFQTFGDRGKDPGLNRVLHGSFEQHADELVRLNNLGAGVFVMVNKGDGIVHPDAKTCRTKANVVAVRALFVDLDGSPIEPVLKMPLLPDIVVESSPGRWHAYWLTEGCPLDEFKERQVLLAEMFDGDPKVCDLPRVMRLPGFLHQKGEPFLSVLMTPEE